MKHKRKKKFIKLGILLFGVPLLFFACIKDDVVVETQGNQKSMFNITIEPYEHLKSQNKKLALKIDKLVENKSLQRSANSQDYGFTINDNNVQIMERDSFTTYTFLIFRDNPEPNILENYVYKESNDGSYEQFILRYVYSIDENENRIYDTTYLDIQTIVDGNLLLNRGGCVPEFVDTLEDMTCTFNVNCTGSSHHEPGSNCPCPNTPTTCYQPGTTVCELKYVYVYVYQGCSGGNPTDGDSNGADNPNNDTSNNGGGDTDNDNELEDWEIPAVPFEDISEKAVQKECRKVNDFLDDPENAAFKQKLLDLANPQNYAENLDVEFEKSITAHENETEIQERHGQVDSASVDISYVVTHPNKTTAWGHLHPNDSLGTYSVFGFDDLVGISKILANNKLDTGTFVAFLITKKGDSLTYYAMTINKKSKFQDFFYAENNYVSVNDNETEKEKIKESFDKLNPLKVKYYEHPTSPLITNYNLDSQQMLTHFLKFMQEADMGTTL